MHNYTFKREYNKIIIITGYLINEVVIQFELIMQDYLNNIIRKRKKDTVIIFKDYSEFGTIIKEVSENPDEAYTAKRELIKLTQKRVTNKYIIKFRRIINKLN